MKVKICGITNYEDACRAVELGADAIGFIFVSSSPRYITPTAARHIVENIPPLVQTVGVFANAAPNLIRAAIGESGIACLQLHEGAQRGDFASFSLPIIKAFRVNDTFDETVLRKHSASAFLLDAYAEGMLGGTGKTFNWNIARRATQYGRIILAGGLNPENIAAAVTTAQPFAVDVNSGVESAPGKKDKEKMRKLFENLGRVPSMPRTPEKLLQ